MSFMFSLSGYVDSSLSAFDFDRAEAKCKRPMRNGPLILEIPARFMFALLDTVMHGLYEQRLDRLLGSCLPDIFGNIC